MIFKDLLPSDIKVSKSSLSQLVDVVSEDINSSVSRRKYQVFVTGGIGPGVTSSLYQTVYDQDFDFQTANPIFDITFGIRPGSLYLEEITNVDSSGKELFPSSSLMMREKFDIYRQFANTLLGSPNVAFSTITGRSNRSPDFISLVEVDDGVIENAVFLTFRRLFSRDQIRKDTFAMRCYKKTVDVDTPGASATNLFVTPDENTERIKFTDVGSTSRLGDIVGNEYGILTNASNPDDKVGLIFYHRGVVVLNLNKIVNTTQVITGTISAVNSLGTETLSGSLVPHLITSASIDQIVDHLAVTRFPNSGETVIGFQNITNINSSLIFCRAAADEFNYSSNPTYVDTDVNSTTPGRVVVMDPGQIDQQTFSFVTSVGLYDANNNLLAVAKLSRPVEKSPERDLTFRVRLDF